MGDIARAETKKRGLLNSADRIRAECVQLADFLVAKNKSYGDSALKPVGKGQ